MRRELEKLNFPKNFYFSQVAEKLHISLKLQSESIYTTTVYHVTFCNWLPIHHGRGIRGNECVMGFVEVEFVVVHVSISTHILIKSASLIETESSQLYLLWLVFGPQTQEVAYPR